MTWPAVRVRTLLGWLVCALLAGIFVPTARADGPALTASFGIAGRYRPGGWYPVTVTVRNPGGDSIAGQLQILSSDTPAVSGRSRPMPSSGGALFARPVSLAADTTTPQTFQIDVRGIDPGTSDVTVQLVEGRERGDGRVLARISTQDQNTSAAITGTPVSDGEPLLVGFGGDPGAFKFLGGQKLSLAHTSGGLGDGLTLPNSLPQLTTQVAEAATAADLPERAAGYGGVDVVLLQSDAPVEALTEAQTEALRGWVASGGHLIVSGGPDTTRFASSFYEGLLPATLNGNTLTVKPQRRAHVLHLASSGAPTAVSGPYGAGTVTLTAVDPALTAHLSAEPFSGYWRPLLLDGGAALLTHTATREEGSTPYYGNGGQTLLSQAVMRGPSLDAPGTEVIGLFLLVYLIVLVPANYFLLKRLDRRELAWVTIPALVLVFALGTFAVGYAAKGGALFVNRAAIVETTAGRREAGVYAEIGLFSPRRTSYDLTVPGENVLAALPNPGLDYGYSSRRSEGQSYGQTHFVQTPDGAALPDMAYNMWAMRAFDVQSTVDLGGTIDAKLTGLSGMIINQTPHKLTDCAILWHGGWQPLGTLAPGASLPVTLPAPGGSTPMGTPPVHGPTDPNDTQADLHARMQASLAAYVGSLGQQTNNYYGGQPPQPYAPASNEALFLGWSNSPAVAGPAPRVDGHGVTENDVSLIVVHIPVAGIATPPNVVPLPISRPPSLGKLLSSLRSPNFGSTTRTSAAYQNAFDARNINQVRSRMGLGFEDHFRGVVQKVTQNPSNHRIGLDFGTQNKPGLVAYIQAPVWIVPSLKTLQGKQVVVPGNFMGDPAHPSVYLRDTTQISIVH